MSARSRTEQPRAPEIEKNIHHKLYLKMSFEIIIFKKILIIGNSDINNIILKMSDICSVDFNGMFIRQKN